MGADLQQLLVWLGMPAKMRLYMDSSAARPIRARADLGRVRHVAIKVMRVEGMLACGRVVVGRVLGGQNCANIGMTPLSKLVLERRRGELGPRRPEVKVRALSAVGRQQPSKGRRMSCRWRLLSRRRLALMRRRNASGATLWVNIEGFGSISVGPAAGAIRKQQLVGHTGGGPISRDVSNLPHFIFGGCFACCPTPFFRNLSASFRSGVGVACGVSLAKLQGCHSVGSASAPLSLSRGLFVSLNVGRTSLGCGRPHSGCRRPDSSQFCRRPETLFSEKKRRRILPHSHIRVTGGGEDRHFAPGRISLRHSQAFSPGNDTVSHFPDTPSVHEGTTMWECRNSF